MVKISKSFVETTKTVIIAVFVASLVAFIGGVKYANAQNVKLQQAYQMNANQEKK